MLQRLHLIVKNMVQQATIFVIVIVVFGCFISPTYAKAKSMRMVVPNCNEGSDPCITLSLDSSRTHVLVDSTTAGHRHDKIQIRYKIENPTLIRDWRQEDNDSRFHSYSLQIFQPDAVYSVIAQTCDTHTVGKDDCYGWTSPEARIWTGPHAVYGSILDEYEATGLMNGSLGAPTSDEEWAGKQKGRYNFFENGAIFWRTGDTFAHAVYGDIYQTWTSLDRENGWLGFPISEQEALTKDNVPKDKDGKPYIQVTGNPNDKITTFECGWIISLARGQVDSVHSYNKQGECWTSTGFHNVS